MHRWTHTKCWLCGRLVRCRSVSALMPAFVNCCGPCAKAIETLPFTERTANTMRSLVPDRRD